MNDIGRKDVGRDRIIRRPHPLVVIESGITCIVLLLPPKQVYNALVINSV